MHQIKLIGVRYRGCPTTIPTARPIVRPDVNPTKNVVGNGFYGIKRANGGIDFANGPLNSTYEFANAIRKGRREPGILPQCDGPSCNDLILMVRDPLEQDYFPDLSDHDREEQLQLEIDAEQILNHLQALELDEQ
jgi:hypothetical protein